MDIPFPQIPVAYAPYFFMALLAIFVVGTIIAVFDSREPKETGESNDTNSP